jgi:2-methylcitrate dehydratase PrpD
MDAIGCALAAHSLQLGTISVAYAARQPGNCSLIGAPGRVSSEAAIFANGQLMNALDLEEVLLNWGHQIPYVLPVALAIGEERRLPGADVIRAVIVGFEVAARVSAALAGPVRVTGTPPDLVMESLPVAGFSANIFGSVATAAVLMGLSIEQTAHAFGIAAFLAPVPSSARFAVVPHVSMAKYGLMGAVAQAGFTAAALAELGYTGDQAVLDGPDGFARMYGSPRYAVDNMVAGLGESWLITRTSFKQYPNCRMIHQAMDVTNALVRRHRLDPTSVKRVRVSLWPRVVASPAFSLVEPQSPTDAQFSIPYAIAATVYGRARYPEFLSPATLRNEAILSLARRVELSAEPRLVAARYERYRAEPVGPIDVAPSQVEIETDEGIFREYAETAIGDPFTAATRLEREDLVRKFRTCAATVLSVDVIDRLVALLPQLGSAPDLTELMRLLSASKDAAPRPTTTLNLETLQ